MIKEESKIYQAVLKTIRLQNRNGDFLEIGEGDLERHVKLCEAIKEADREYDRVLSAYPKEYYELFLAPSVVDISLIEAEGIANLFNIEAHDRTTYGSRVVKCRDSYYRVWLNISFCG